MSPLTASEPSSRSPLISLAMIARDRARELRRALESVAPYVDEIVVVDAGGSTDDTCEVAKSFGAKVIPFLPADHPEAFFDDTEEVFASRQIAGPYSGRKVLADFSAPRNVSFEACSGKYIFWIDSDDVVVGAPQLRGMVEIMERDGFDAMMFDYDYAHDDEGRVVLKQKRERLVRRGTCRWEGPIHEHLAGAAFEKKVAYNEYLKVKHAHVRPRRTIIEQGDVRVAAEEHDEVVHRNLKNLVLYQERMAAADEPLAPAYIFYLGNEWRVLDVEKAIGWYVKYLDVAENSAQRSQARYYIGQIREAQQAWEEAWNWMAGAALDFPASPAPWFSLARLALVRGDWPAVIQLSDRGFEAARSKDLHSHLIFDPIEVQYRSLLPYTRALIEVGRYTDALKLCNDGLTVMPDCKYLSTHKLMCLEKVGGLQ